MGSSKNPEITQLFLAARALDPDAREAFLDRECSGRPERRRAVEDLLSHDVDGATEQLRARVVSPGVAGSDGQRTSAPIPDRIGSKEVLRKIGHGGMGVVYLARDLDLDREVAIKALPEDFVRSPERLARFEREAKTLARLNHPNVAGIHGLEELDGRRYLVLEYVDGDTLADRVKAGPLPLDDALEIAVGIARGVEAAHNAGVVHRDLKPANIKITPEGQVKVLDFGLATDGREAAGADDSSADRRSPTIPGAILGTAAYMSPEQARGRVVDRRTDLWSLGVVLYEMLTGVCPFAGETVSDSIGSVLHKEVDLDRLPRAAPQRVRELLQRMLQRDRDLRMRDAGDVMLELEMARTEPAAAQVAVRASRVPLALGALGLVVAAIAVGWSLIGSEEPMRLRFSQVTDFEGTATQPSLTPDGRTVVYAWRRDGGDDWDIYTQRIEGSNRVNLTAGSDADDEQPAVSPDGKWIAFRSNRDPEGLFIMGATGESPRRLTADGADPAWSPDSTKIAFVDESIVDPLRRLGLSRLHVVTVEDGLVIDLTDSDAVEPSWSPDGSRIAFWANDGGQRDLYTVASDGSEPPRPVLEDATNEWSPAWSADGRWLYFSSDRAGTWDLWRVRVDQRTGRRRGDPEPVTAGLSGLHGWLDVADASDRLVFASRTEAYTVYRATFDPIRAEFVEEPERVTSPTYPARRPSVSSDGQWVAYEGERENEDIFVIRADGTDRRQLTSDAAKDRGPVWSPNGERIYFHSNRDGTFQIWSCRRDGSDVIRHTDLDGITSARLSPDGKRLAAVVGSRLALFDARQSHEEQTPEFVDTELRGRVLVVDWADDGFLLAVISRASIGVQVALVSPQGEVLSTQERASLIFGGVLLEGGRALWGSSEGVLRVDSKTGEWVSPGTTDWSPQEVTSLAASVDRRVVVFAVRTQRSQIRVARELDRD